MKLLLQTLIVFFGTLMTAGLVALGEPASSGRRPASKALQLSSSPAQVPAVNTSSVQTAWQAAAAATSGSVAR